MSPTPRNRLRSREGINRWYDVTVGLNAKAVLRRFMGDRPEWFDFLMEKEIIWVGSPERLNADHLRELKHVTSGVGLTFKKG